MNLCVSSSFLYVSLTNHLLQIKLENCKNSQKNMSNGKDIYFYLVTHLKLGIMLILLSYIVGFQFGK